jgi:hypothetical protein
LKHDLKLQEERNNLDTAIFQNFWAYNWKEPTLFKKKETFLIGLKGWVQNRSTEGGF